MDTIVIDVVKRFSYFGGAFLASKEGAGAGF
jgi:hypothetical protein